VLVVLLVLDRRGWLLVRSADDLAAYHGREAMVTHVVDGDTIDVALPDALAGHDVTRVRLWGIDCPELAHFGKSEEPLAREATRLTESVVGNHRVRLFLEAHEPRDSFGRVLAHVELIDDGRSLNEALLDAGLAKADDHWPHSRLTRYAQVQLSAQRRGVGIWAKDKGAIQSQPASR